MKRNSDKHPASRRRNMFAERLECRYLLAGPYAPAAGMLESTAIDKGDPAIVGWASSVVDYSPGSDVDAAFQSVGKAIGPANGTVGDTVSLGRGGSITLAFEYPVRDGLGFDFAVFENAFSDAFLELGYVEVSSDGVNFFRFANASLTSAPVDAFGSVDPTNVHNLAGKYRQGFGTPFDLEELRGVSSLLDTSHVSHVRIVDIVGDGNAKDSSNRVIYDPFPTVGSAGFDLDAVGVLHQADVGEDVISFEDVGATLASQSAFNGPVPGGIPATGPFQDSVVLGKFQSEELEFNNTYSLDYGSWNQWAYSNVTDSVTPGYTNQFGVITGAGGNGTATFGIGFPDQGGAFEPPTIVKPSDDVRVFSSLLVTNTTYAALSMRDGDSFAKKFGGASGNDADYFLLTVTGKNDSGQSIGSVDFYLADYRFSDNSLDYIVDEWTKIDLTSIGEASSLEFSVTSSDVGPFGINTPAFFAVDEITLTTPAIYLDLADQEVSESDGSAATIARVSRASPDTSSSILVNLAPVNGAIATLPSSVTIPVGQPYVEFPIGTIDNDLVHGDRTITIAANADGMLGSERSLLVRDDDQLALTLTFSAQSLTEGGSGTATVHRNGADLSSPLLVHVTTNEPSLFSFNETLTIDAGKSSVAFTINALDDELDRPNSEFEFSVSASGYSDSAKSVMWIDNDVAQLLLVADPSAWDESLARPTADLEDVGRSLVAETYYNGSDLSGGFASGGLTFNNDFNATFDSWSGWSFSNTTDSTAPGFENQYSAWVGGGASGSDTYAVAAAYGFPALPSIRRESGTLTPFRSIEITNTTYAALSMLQGDAFAKKFGGESGDDPDWLLLTIEGFNGDQESIGTIEFYLADYRFSDNALDYIVDKWTDVSLDAISDAEELRFSMTSSDVGAFGMNTPAYFAVDNIVLNGEQSSPTITVSRNSFDVSGDLQIHLGSNDTTELRVPSQVVIPSGAASVTVPIEVIDDRLVDGTQIVQLSAVADSFSDAVSTFSVLDDDTPSLTLTIDSTEANESNQLLRAVVHRNLTDLSASLDVSLTVDTAGELQFPDIVSIPAGARSVEFMISTVDNSLGEGDRSVRVDASAPGFASAGDSIVIIDDELSLRLEFDRDSMSESDAAASALLEDIGAVLPMNAFYNGADGAGGFVSGPVSFNNSFDTEFGSWGGWSVSNMTDRTTPGFLNQYSASVGEGALGSATYAVASAFPGGLTPTIDISEAVAGASFNSIMVSNTTYAALSMAEGDAFAKKFGGESGDDPDFFLLSIEGVDSNGQSVGQVDVYLADYRFADNTQDFILNEWLRVDLSDLVGATCLEFALSSSDVGMFGMNTPAYFAVDQIELSEPARNPILATVHRDGNDLSDPLLIQLASSDESEVRVPSSVTIPSGAASVTFEIDAVDDAVVDGSQEVVVTVTADAFLASDGTISVQDDDQPMLTVSAVRDSIGESDGAEASSLLIHRNMADLSAELMVQLEANLAETVLPSEVAIPAGSASVLIPFGVVNNTVRDGDRVVTIEISSDNLPKAMVPIQVVDDERSEIIVAQSDGSTVVSELLLEDEIQVTLSAQPLSNVVVSIHSTSDDFAWSPSLVTFTPDDWNQPRAISISGRPDLLIEGDEVQELVIEVDAAASDTLFDSTLPHRVEVEVQDSNPSQLRIGENAFDVFLVDEASGVKFINNSLADGIHVVANDGEQSVEMNSLIDTRGLVQLETRGGNDTVVLRGRRFTLIDGGDGFDSLVMSLDEPVDFVNFLDQRVVHFEEYVLASESGASLLIGSDGLSSVAAEDGTVLLRVTADQVVMFDSNAVLVQPRMYGDEFAQVVEVGNTQVVVISASSWQNIRSPWDVNGNGDVTSLDALSVVNEIARRDQPELPVIVSLEEFHGFYYDVSADGLITALDALRVINEIARRDLSGEFEWVITNPSELNRLPNDQFNRQNVDDLLPRAVGDSPNVNQRLDLAGSHDQAVQQLFVASSQEESVPRVDTLPVDSVDDVLSLLEDSRAHL